MPPLASMLVFSSSGVLLVHRPPLVETHLVLGMEHSDLASDAATGQYVCLVVVLRVWLEDNLPNLSLDIGRVIVLGMRPDKVDWVIVEVVLLIARLLLLLPLNPLIGGRTVRLRSLLVQHHPI